MTRDISRMLSNRESAKKSRLNKLQYVNSLEIENIYLKQIIVKLNEELGNIINYGLETNCDDKFNP